MQVLIVARTNMTDRVCVGAVDRSGRSRRLLVADGENQPQDCPYQIGDIWTVRTKEPNKITPPHVEDVIVEPQRREGTCNDLPSTLHRMRDKGLITTWWQGAIASVFDGHTRSTQTNFSRYVSHTSGLPNCSVGFWEPHEALHLETTEDRPSYRFETPGEFARLPYTGQEQPEAVLPRGTLVRLSLSRFWAPPDGGRSACWVQLSGWYRP